MNTFTTQADSSDAVHILVVPQFHYDVAYLKTEEQYYVRCWDNLRAAIALMDASPEYRYMVEQPFLLEQFAARCPEDFARLQQCHARGQLEVGGAMYVIPDMNLPSGESLIRHVLYGKRWVEEAFGTDVRTAWSVDTWGHPETLPQILRHCGVDAYFFTRAMHPDVRQGDFLWVGLDGTTLPTHWLPNGYASLRFPEAHALENAAELDMTDATESGLMALTERIRPFLAQNLVLLCNGGDMAAPQPTAAQTMARWQARGLPVRFGTVAEYAEQLQAHQEDLPRITGDFNPLFIGTQASRIRLKQQNRKLENALITAERLHAALRLAGEDVPPLALDGVWKTLLKNQFHDIISGTLVDAAYHDAMNDYAAAFAACDARLAELRTTTEMSGVFNPSGWERREWVPASGGQGTAPVSVPALGWAALPEQAAAPVAPEVCAGDIVLENEFWRVTVGENGTLTSVIDVQTEQQFVPAGGPGWGDLVYRNDNGDLWLLDRGPLSGGSEASKFTEPQSDDPYRGSADPLVNDNPVCQHGRAHRRMQTERSGEQTVWVSGTLGFWNNQIGFETRITLRADDPLIWFQTTAHCRGRHYRLYACFPTPWADATARHHIPFGATKRDDRRYAAQDGAEAVGPDGNGVRVLNAGLPGSAVNQGVLSLLLMRSAAMEYKAESTDAFEDGQTLVFEYAVRPFTSSDPGQAVREGERLNRPVYVSAGESLPTQAATPKLQLAPENVHLSAFYALDDGDFLLRVCECAGWETPGQVHLGRTNATVWESNGAEERGDGVPLSQDGSLSFTLRPWEIRSWRVAMPERR